MKILSKFYKSNFAIYKKDGPQACAGDSTDRTGSAESDESGRKMYGRVDKQRGHSCFWNRQYILYGHFLSLFSAWVPGLCTCGAHDRDFRPVWRASRFSWRECSTTVHAGFYWKAKPIGKRMQQRCVAAKSGVVVSCCRTNADGL